MEKLLKKAEETHELTKEEIVSLLEFPLTSQLSLLTQSADRVRKKYVGDEVHLRGLIEFSNYCKQNCLYCGFRRDNKNVTRYRLTEEQIIGFAKDAATQGYKTVVLQSGEDPYFTVDKMKQIISEIKKFDLAITLSIGEKTFEEYEAYKNAGANRFLIRIETTDKNLYTKLDPDMDWQNRLKCLNNLRELGYEVGTGCLVGLPEQTLESLAEDILFFKEINADMIGIGPFIPNENTPLKDAQGGTFELALKVMAITRLLLPDINIPATTAMETLNPNGRLIALQSGANVVMPNVTQGDYRKFYEIYPGKICVNDTPTKCRGCITGKIKSINRSVSTDYGFRRKIQKTAF
ncbi:MAG: [FeFe] hydrogenase H-cluster radical SAM maturase HydE [bacterium]